MNTIRRVYVNPGMPARELQMIWDAAYRDTKNQPGNRVVIVFAPGTYTAPAGGALVYASEPELFVREPGAELTISYVSRAANWHVDYKAVMWQERREGPAA